jgi:hypothetical protein
MDLIIMQYIRNHPVLKNLQAVFFLNTRNQVSRPRHFKSSKSHVNCSSIQAAFPRLKCHVEQHDL